ncbi:MAG: trypsin-like serine protease [Actinomycetia bacterium]|nr:trypsin-like serine protease [Actinomycetes bacterium]
MSERPFPLRVLLVGLALVLAACSSGDNSGDSTPTTGRAPGPTTTSSVAPTTTTAAPTTTTTIDPLAGAVGPETAGLAQATVQVIQLVESGAGYEPFCGYGSGGVISADGTILTNAHVIEADSFCAYDAIGVAISHTADRPPELTYLADLLVFDEVADLAVLRISTDLDGNEVSPELPFLAVGDSDAVEIGDTIRILGFPAIGGETITFTQGAVSGFTLDATVDGRAWIKTDATISGGNSGGIAVDVDGFLIGVPTQVGSGSLDAEVVDCRVITDTNGDGAVDDTDTCTPIGGFINGVRPVGVALPLIDDAQDAVPLELPGEPEIISPDTEPFFSNISFSPGFDDNGFSNAAEVLLASDSATVCGHWDYESMADGLVWDAFWYVDGEFIEQASTIGESWGLGESGSAWTCIDGGDEPLSDGTYELALAVDTVTVISDVVFVGDQFEPATFELVNESPDPVCYVQLSPTLAESWGPDRLGATEVIDSGSTREFDVVASSWDLRLFDCVSDDPLVEEYEIPVEGYTPFVFAG